MARCHVPLSPSCLHFFINVETKALAISISWVFSFIGKRSLCEYSCSSWSLNCIYSLEKWCSSKCLFANQLNLARTIVMPCKSSPNGLFPGATVQHIERFKSYSEPTNAQELAMCMLTVMDAVRSRSPPSGYFENDREEFHHEE